MAIKHRNKDKKPTRLKFETLYLNESNVNMIFERCLANEEDDRDSRLWVTLLDTHFGFSKVDRGIGFNKQKIKDNKRNILYLLGQLDKSHNNDDRDYRSFEFSLASMKYDGTQWTLSPANLSKLFYLADAVGAVGLFRKVNEQTIVHIRPDEVYPTLSPTDPNFDAWWAEHKSDWEDDKMARHRFGMMYGGPKPNERYDNYEPEEYICMPVHDDYIRPLSEKLAVLDCFWNTLDRPEKNLAYSGITLIPPSSFDEFIEILDGTTGTEGLRWLIKEAKKEDRFIIHFGI